MAHRGRKNADAALALALASGLTIEAAAEQAGVSARTAHRRLADPAFMERARQAGDELMIQGAGLLAGTMTAAISTLRELLNAESEGTRLRAALALVDLTLKVRVQVESTQRVAEIEAVLQPKGHNRL
jgi:hypothetical protein